MAVARYRMICLVLLKSMEGVVLCKSEKVPMGIQGEKSRKDEDA